MACPPATARALKGLSRPSGRRCDRRSRGATTARDTDDASLHGEGQVREDSTPAGETGGDPPSYALFVYMFARARDLALAVLTPSGLDASAYHPVARLGVHVSDEVSTCSPTATL